MTKPIADLSVPHDRHAPRASLPPAERGAPAPARGHYYAPDPIELWCPGCTAGIGEDGRLSHERSCPFRHATS